MTHLLPQPLISKLKQLDITTLTKIQNQTIPHILDGDDLLVSSPTSSGKTLSFALPLYMQTKAEQKHIQALILAPTRELALQIQEQFRAISYIDSIKVATLYGGVAIQESLNQLKAQPQIIIATPGRLIDLINKELIDISLVDRFVLDEADKMLDMGFYDDIVYISSKLSPNRQTLLFSATYPQKIKTLSSKILNNPQEIINEQKANIQEMAFEVKDRYQALKTTLSIYHDSLSVIFCNTKESVLSLYSQLQADKYPVVTFHGNLSQEERIEAIKLFVNKTKPILIATDLASRGLDIVEIDSVIQYDMAFDKDTYTHRIGRTSRKDKVGKAISLYNSHQKSHLQKLSSSIEFQTLPNLQSLTTITSDRYTLVVKGGKKDKLRKGDIVGTLCKEVGLESSSILQIDIEPTLTYIALSKDTLPLLQNLSHIKIKKRKYKLILL